MSITDDRSAAIVRVVYFQCFTICF